MAESGTPQPPGLKKAALPQQRRKRRTSLLGMWRARFFLESDEELENLRTTHKSGELLTGDMKAKTISVLQEFVIGFQERRKKVVIDEFMDCKRQLVWGQGKKKEEGKKAEVVEMRS